MSHFISRQDIDKNKLSVFLRDLSTDLNVNLKHMIEDTIIKVDEKNKKESKNYQRGKKKKPVMKKKDIIIQQQNEKRKKDNIKEDYNRIKYLIENLDIKEPFKLISNLRTEEGIVEYKFLLLNKYWNEKRKNMKFILLLFSELQNSPRNEEDKKIIDKIKTSLEECDYKLFMMKHMGDMLPPLNYWINAPKKFDEWQKEVINYINKKESVIVKAPTSSGKSFIAMASGILHNKVLYVCPAKPVAYQVGSHFIHMGYKVHFLLDNISHFSYNSQTNIFIGTPKEIEANINKIGFEYDYTVFDEIHNLNRNEDGHIYENIIKSVNSNFVALSATVNNINFLRDLFQKINPKHKINYVEYNKRFINHQRWIWDGDKLNYVHPLSVYDNINDNYENNQLSYTPRDCAIIWEKIYEVFEDIDIDTDLLDDCSPDDYFKEEGMLSLDDCKEYEMFIKNKLTEWSNKYPTEVQEIFNSFKVKRTILPKIHENDNIIQFIQNVKKKDMFPMIMFHMDECECKNIFNRIFEYLNKKEIEEYPFHYDILEKKEELYQKYVINREKFRTGIKVNSNATNAQYDIKEKLDNFDRKEKNTFIESIIQYYNQKLNEINKTENEKIKKVQRNNLKREMNQFISNPDFCSQDVFKKHVDFIFTNSNEPMSGETIREVRREIKNTLGIKIPYESPLFQMLKRGIGIYIENMPDEYNWILQKLLSKKEIGIVISDETLCLGIDLPVRTSCFLGINGNKITNENYLQMSGRAGRRGKDTQGNIIFYGDIDHSNLMRSSNPDIIGCSKPIYDNYKVLRRYREEGHPIFKNLIHSKREYIQVGKYNTLSSENDKLIWHLRNYKDSIYFISQLYNYEINLYKMNENDRPMYIIQKIYDFINNGKNEIFNCYKLKKLNHYSDLNIIKEYIEILMGIYNNTRKDKYMILRNTCLTVFKTLNYIVFNSII